MRNRGIDLPPEMTKVTNNALCIMSLNSLFFFAGPVILNSLDQQFSEDMNIEFLRDYCLSRRGAAEDFPFDEDTLVFKVGGKMFALTSFSEPDRVNLKCDPDLAVQLREQYAAVGPGYHMSKKHWNTVRLDGTISDSLLKKWIDHSYDLVVQSLPKKVRDELKKL